MARTVYSVVFRFSPDSLTWLVNRGDEEVSRYRRKDVAVRAATALARSGGNAVLTVERMDGTVQYHRRYRGRPPVRREADRIRPR